MLLNLTLTRPPATDLGHLLHKHPERLGEFPLPFGRAHVFYSEVSEPRRTAALLFEVDPVGLIRRGVRFSRLDQYDEGSALPTHQAVIVAFDPMTGEPQALLDGTAITAIRTGAASALSVRLLAREDARTLARLGSGVQARSHAGAIARVRPLTEIRVASRNPAHANALARELEAELGVQTQAYASHEEAVRGADVVAAVTHSPEPVVRREWLAPGTHVTSVGVNPHGRELDGETVRDALLVVESRAAALAPFPGGSNDLLWAIRDGLVDEHHVHAELGELVTGSKTGRADDQQLTLYKSVGVAIQDAAAASLVLRHVTSVRTVEP